jgi:hypothetical protein
MQILLSNISPEHVTISKGKVKDDDTALKIRRLNPQELSVPTHCVASVSNSVLCSVPPSDPIVEAMKNAAEALGQEQRGLLERLLRKHASVFSSGPTDIWRTSVI